MTATVMLSPHFSAGEFACKDGTCIPDALLDNARLLCAQLEVIRAAIGHPVVILSGYRTPSWNKGKGVEHSQHLLANAADIRVAGIGPEKVHGVVMYLIGKGELDIGGVGLYLPNEKRSLGWCHLDRGPKGRRWNG
jgi:uncharacterized protein YcbK (DUF882 family)